MGCKEISFERFKLWRWVGKVASPDLIISCHGGSFIPGSFTVPGSAQQLVFYGPHGYTLLDPGVGLMANGRYNTYETVATGNTTNNYSLTKFQGHHDTMATQLPIIGGAAKLYRKHFASSSSFSETYDVVKSKVQKFHVDVVTIRYRPGILIPITLKGLLQALDKDGYSYDRVHCAFCRYQVGYSMTGHDADQNTSTKHKIESTVTRFNKIN